MRTHSGGVGHLFVSGKLISLRQHLRPVDVYHGWESLNTLPDGQCPHLSTVIGPTGGSSLIHKCERDGRQTRRLLAFGAHSPQLYDLWVNQDLI